MIQSAPSKSQLKKCNMRLKNNALWEQRKARFTRANMSSNIWCEHQTLLLLQQFVTGNCHVLVRAPGAPMSSNFSSNITQLALIGNRGWLLVCCVLFEHTQHTSNLRTLNNLRTFYSPCEGISLSLADFLSLT